MRPLLASSLSLLVLLGIGCAPLARARPRARTRATTATAQAPREPHPILVAYRESLRPFLGAAEQAALDAIDWSGTDVGDTERLRWLAADRAVRRVLPIVLESEGIEALDEHAARLRALPPLLSRDLDAVAAPVVVEAMVALDRARRGAIPRPPSPPLEEAVATAAGTDDLLAVERALAQLPSERLYPADPEGEADMEEALTDYAVAYARASGASPLQATAAAAAAADTVDVAFLVGRALQLGAGRERVLGEALALAEDMCTAARRREQLPTVRHDAGSGDDR